MLFKKNEMLESRNFIDGVDFTCDDECIFVTYPNGAAGDLLISIIDKHYLRTGCEYYGIADNGRVHMFTTDYEMMDLYRAYEFTDKWFYDLAENLGNRNLNYSLLDQVIIGVHMHTPEENQYILNTFNKCKIINIYPYDSFGDQIIRKLAHAKLKNKIIDLDYTNNIDYTNNNSLNSDPRIINIPFGCLFNEELFEKTYKNIINFLDLPGKLIRYDFIKYYLSKQQNGMDKELIDYSTLLNKNMNNIH